MNLTVEHSTSTAHRLMEYDGACSNVHGHNFKWEVEMKVEVPEDGSNMSIDFKEVTDELDTVDHAILLNASDPLVDNVEALGKFITFDGDPTCELVGDWMAKRLAELDNVVWVRIRLSETDKYTAAGFAYAPEHRPKEET